MLCGFVVLCHLKANKQKQSNINISCWSRWPYIMAQLQRWVHGSVEGLWLVTAGHSGHFAVDNSRDIFKQQRFQIKCFLKRLLEKSVDKFYGYEGNQVMMIQIPANTLSPWGNPLITVIMIYVALPSFERCAILYAGVTMPLRGIFWEVACKLELPMVMN